MMRMRQYLLSMAFNLCGLGPSDRWLMCRITKLDLNYGPLWIARSCAQRSPST